MKDEILEDQDVKILLKASIDYNSGILTIVSTVLNNQVKARHVIREVKRHQEVYNRIVKKIVEKYDNDNITD